MSTSGTTYVIAEAGVNHNGSLQMAKDLIDAATECGANAVKFQTFQSDKLVSVFAEKAEYQKRLTNQNESQLEMLKKLELDKQSHFILAEHCKKNGIEFLSTPFDLDSVRLLTDELDVLRIKISSGDITNAPLLLETAKSGKPVFLSTGVSMLGEVEQALSVLAFGYLHSGKQPGLAAFREAYASAEGQKTLKEKVTLLHCTSEYPAPFIEINLRSMDALYHAFGLPVGLSDHSVGISIPLAAVARGASVIEKHFTLDNTLPGPDHQASLEPKQLKEMVRSIREIEQALGSGIKHPSPSEMRNKAAIRKSLVAGRDLHKGMVFADDNLLAKRPGNGISPMYYWEWIGKEVKRDYRKDEVIEHD